VGISTRTFALFISSLKIFRSVFLVKKEDKSEVFGTRFPKASVLSSVASGLPPHISEGKPPVDLNLFRGSQCLPPHAGEGRPRFR
jgi:hypothetical protein